MVGKLETASKETGETASPLSVLGTLPDSDRAKVSADHRSVVLGLDLVLQAKTGLAQYRRDNRVAENATTITPDLDAKIAVVHPVTAVQIALGLVSLHDASIFQEQAEQERYLREHNAELAETGTFADYTSHRDILKRHIATIGEAALQLFPTADREPDGIVRQLADEMHRL